MSTASSPTRPRRLSDSGRRLSDSGRRLSISDGSIPIPPDLLAHEAIKDHPHIKELHDVHGGVPADADHEVLDKVLDFTNAVAHHGVDPTKMRRSDPSPRRAARVFRAEVLGHREASVSPERRRSLSATRGLAAGSPGGEGDGAANPRSGSRYRSRSRAPRIKEIKEHPEDEEAGNGAGGGGWVGEDVRSGRPGRRDDEQGAREGADRALENRLQSITQQQHNFHDRMLHALNLLEEEYAQIEARNKNRINYYLGEELVPVTNGRNPIPRHLPALTSINAIQSMPGRDVRAWLAYYSGRSPQQLLDLDRRRNASADANDTDWVSQDLRRALRACTGAEPVFMT